MILKVVLVVYITALIIFNASLSTLLASILPFWGAYLMIEYFIKENFS